MFNINNLSAQSQNFLKAIASKDGYANNISSLDLLKSSKSELKQLLTEIKKDGYSKDEQGLVEIIYRLTQKDSLDTKKGLSKAYDLEGKAAPSIEFIKEDFNINPNKNNEVRETLLTENLIDSSRFNSGKNEIGSPAKKVKNVDSFLKAKENLKTDFGFDPKNPYDLKELKKFAKTIPQEKMPEFIDNYMTAFYAHPGDDTKWTIPDKEAESVFFGNPPELAQLPDGRYLMDCQGFTQLGKILFDNLIDDKFEKQAVYLPIQITSSNLSKKGEGLAAMQMSREVEKPELPKPKPTQGHGHGHEIGLMKIEDKAYIIDNDKLTEITITDKELDLLNMYHFGKLFLGDFLNLNDLQLDRKTFPSVFEYTDNGFSGHNLFFDENDVLKDG